MTQLDEIAGELAASGRTLRRAALRGTIRCSRPTPRRFLVDAHEREYVRRHWPLLAGMLQVLRTRPDVSFAVVFGSVSRGDDHPGSDVDVLVQFADPSLRALSTLTDRLEQATGRPVQIVELESAEGSPPLLADVLRDGRVLVDRGGAWSRLKRREQQILADAKKAEDTDLDEITAALEEMFA